MTPTRAVRKMQTPAFLRSNGGVRAASGLLSAPSTGGGRSDRRPAPRREDRYRPHFRMYSR